MSRQIILASKSPRRKILLRQIGLKFTVATSDIDERSDDNLTPAELVMKLAAAKAGAVARALPDAIVIGADTVVVLDGKILGKPADADEAKLMLRTLSGNTHRVYTGFCIIDTASSKTVSDHEVTEVTFRQLSEREIGVYVASGSPMDKAGAYGIQDDYGAIFVEKINGCFYNVVGFPLTRFYTSFREFGKTVGLSEEYNG